MSKKKLSTPDNKKALRSDNSLKKTTGKRSAVIGSYLTSQTRISSSRKTGDIKRRQITKSTLAPQDAVTPLQTRVRSALVTACLTIPTTPSLPSGKLTTEQRAALARRINGERPMSDLISEDRER